MHEKNHDDFFDNSGAGADPEKTLLDMLEKYDKPLTAAIEVGAKVTGKIISIGKQFALVDINAKNEAMMKITELMDSQNAVTKKPGDAIEAYIVSTTNSEILLSTVLSSKAGHGKSSMEEMRAAMNNQIPVEGRVTGINKGGFNIRIMGQRAFCPISQIDLKRVEDPNQFLNASLPFVITQITEGGRNIVVSRLPLLSEGLLAVIDNLKQGIAEKKPYMGTITRITPFGLFIDLGELEGLAHISEVAWDRTEDLNKDYEVGQKVSCIVIGVEKKEPLRNSKISLSLKQATQNPWDTASEHFKAGQSVQGKITRLANFGAFVQLCPGIEGLIHVSEMSWGKKIRHPSDVVAPGQVVQVTLLSVDQNKREIACSLKDMESDPWKNIREKLPVAGLVSGTVAQQTKFGYFIDFAEGMTGLLPFANISADKKESIKVGGLLEVTIESIDEERRRISLSCGVAQERKNDEEVKAYLSSQTKPATVAQAASETVLGAALKKAMEKGPRV
jgi:small subunit ribosomal protein S1